MKRHIILIVGIFLIGGLVIFMPNFLSSLPSNNIRGEVKQIPIEEHSSSLTTIETLETEQLEIGIHDSDQMYFENIEKLYDYFMFGQVEDIKQKVQFYVHEYINGDLLDCKLLYDSIIKNGDIITFNLEMKNIDSFKVEITSDNENEINNIAIIHDIKKTD